MKELPSSEQKAKNYKLSGAQACALDILTRSGRIVPGKSTWRNLEHRGLVCFGRVQYEITLDGIEALKRHGEHEEKTPG